MFHLSSHIRWIHTLLSLILIFWVKTSKKFKYIFLIFQLPSQVKIFTYHYLYDGTDFLADVGGYLGLFLGFSVFSLVEIVEKYIEILNKKRKETRELESPKTELDTWSKFLIDSILFCCNKILSIIYLYQKKIKMWQTL